MKLLVPLEPVLNPKLWELGQTLSEGAPAPLGGDPQINPFDEHALESALRLTENGLDQKTRLGEVVAVSVGPPGTERILRTALAQGAQRAIHVISEGEVDGHVVALALAEVARRELPQAIVMGKQSAAWENAQTGARLAGLLGWTHFSRVHAIEVIQDRLQASTECDGRRRELRTTFPLILTVDLDVTSPTGTRTSFHPLDFAYYEGLRFISFQSILRAKHKPIETLGLRDLVETTAPLTQAVGFAPAPRRSPCRMAADVDELVRELRPLLGELR